MESTKTLKLRIKDKHARVLSAMAREVNTVWNFCVRREVASSIVAAIATDSPMSRTLGGHAELATARCEAPLTTYPRILGCRRESVRESAVLEASIR